MRLFIGIKVVMCFVAMAAASTALGSGSVWQADGVPVCVAAGTQEIPSMASLGADGTVIAWADNRSGQYDIYAQKLDSQGQPAWAVGGIPVCTAAYDQQFASAVPDGGGGVIVMWQDGRLGDDGLEIYAQRILPDGSLAWQTNGVPVCIHAPGLVDPPVAFSLAAVADGSGGAIVVWRDTRNDLITGNTEIYAQRINGSGAPQWQANGVRVLAFNTATWPTRNPVACADGSGGAVIVWQDGRNYSSSSYDLYVQRIDASGSLLWAANGIRLCGAVGDQGYVDIAMLGVGDAVAVWEDKRSGNYDIYAQRIEPSGAVEWGIDGRLIVSVANDQRTPRVAITNTEDVVVGWSDGRVSPSSPDIYAQRLDGSGNSLWRANGVTVCDAIGWQGRVRLCPGASDSTAITWMDNRVDPSNATYNYDIYSQILDFTGTALLQAEGASVSTAQGTQRLQQAAADGSGGAYVVWEDNRNEGNWDIYSQRVAQAAQPIPVSGIREAKTNADGIVISMPAMTVTAVFSGFFYIEEQDRSSGIKIVSVEQVNIGDLVVITGTMRTSGERYVEASSVAPAN